MVFVGFFQQKWIFLEGPGWLNGQWFSPGTPDSSTTKTGRHDIAEILLKVALKHQQSINQTKLDLPRSENVDI